MIFKQKKKGERGQGEKKRKSQFSLDKVLYSITYVPYQVLQIAYFTAWLLSVFSEQVR